MKFIPGCLFGITLISVFQSSLAVTDQRQNVEEEAAESPSFNCKKAKSPSETLICTDKDLSALDRELASLDIRARKRIGGSSVFISETRNAWKWREENCKTKECVATWYADRKAYYVSLLEAGNTNETFVVIPPGTPLDQDTEGIYHFKESSGMSCNEKKITAEINDALKHPQNLSSEAFQRIAAEGKCSPWSPAVNFKVLRFETFTVPAGPQKVAYGVLYVDGYPPDYFYAMQEDIEKVKSLPKKASAYPKVYYQTPTTVMP